MPFTCRLKMAPKRGRVNEKNNVVQGYLHGVTPVRSFGVTRKCFNCILQTSRDEYRGCVVFGTKKHARFVQAADKHTPLKLSKVRNPSKLYIMLSNACLFYLSAK